MKIAMVFPGQGSQTVGMLSDIAEQFPQVEETFSQASSVLGYNLWQLVKQGPSEELDKTEYTQPALLTASYAIWRILQTKSVQPVLMAGHSLGEYTALVCAQALSFTDAVKLVAARGRFMQEAVPFGTSAMAAVIGLDEKKVEEICSRAKNSEDEVISPANFNSAGQIVIAGHTTAVERAVTLAKEQGAKLALLLPVSAASHCELMRPAAQRLAESLSSISFSTPDIPVVNNVDVKIYDTADSIKDGLVRQLCKPVRWVETIEVFQQLGITKIIECGPGKVLTGLIKRMHKNIELKTTHDLAALEVLKNIDKEKFKKTPE